MSEAQNMDKMELLFDDLEKPEAIVEAQYSSELLLRRIKDRATLLEWVCSFLLI